MSMEIGGPFDGLTGFLSTQTEATVRRLDVKPSRFTKHFSEMLKYRHNFPDNVKLLNVYGDWRTVRWPDRVSEHA
ncbi:hypothetical protein WP50_39320, partial [Lactiplantibacillus plantarum]